MGSRNMKTKPIRKIVGVLLLIVLILIIAAAVSFRIFGNSIIKAGIEKAAANALKVPVTIDKLRISVFAGSVELEGLIVANPRGYQHENLLDAGRVKVAADLGTLTDDTVRIDEMIFEQVEVVLEQKGLTNNLQTILDSMEKPAEKPGKTEKPEKNLLVKNLQMNDIRVKVKLLPVPGKADTLTLNLAPVRMTDLGTDDKLSVAKLSGIILTAIAAGIAESGRGLMPEEITDPLSDFLKAAPDVIIETGKEFLNGAGNVLKGTKDVLEGGSDAAKDFAEGIKGIFPTDEKED